MTQNIETAVRDNLPTDTMLADDEVNDLVAAIHVATTGCNLAFEDFLPGDPPCIDGGLAIHHRKV